ncbi:MAG: sigma-70 family RNA polymerase sigma factor [Planctomycetota bacterium]
MTDPSDVSDVAAWVSQRDEAALTRLVERHARMVATVCRRELGDGAAADEAAQAVFIILARRAGRISDPLRLGSWLFGVALRVCRTTRRANARRTRHEHEAAMHIAAQQIPDVAAEATWTDIRPHLNAAIASLSEAQRAVVVDHYLGGVPQTALADRLGISEDAAHQRVHYALKKLREWFAKRGLSVGAGVLSIGLASEAAAVDVSVVATCTQAATHPLAAPGAAKLASAATVATVSKLLIAAAVIALIAGGVALATWSNPSPNPVSIVVSAPPPPAKDANAAWQGPEREILRWLVPGAPMRAAVDMTTLRRLAATAKPTSMLFDPQAQPAWNVLSERLSTLIGGELGVSTVRGMLNARSAALSLTSADANLFVCNLGLSVDSVKSSWQKGATEKGATTYKLPQATLAGFSGWTFRDVDKEFVGFCGDLYAGGKASLLTERAGAVGALPEPDVSAPAWLVADLAPVIAAYAKADTTHTDPIGIGKILGPDWRKLHPRMSIAVDARAGTWSTETRMSGAVPFSPLTLVAVAANTIPTTTMPARFLRRPDPAKLPQVRSGALATLTLGSTAGALRAMLNGTTDPTFANLSKQPGVAEVIDAWSGDAAAVIESGVPFPTCTVVIGLRQPLNPEAVTSLCAALVPLTPMDAVAGTRAAWQGFTPAGMLTVLLADGRLVISTAPDATMFLAAAAQAPDAGLMVSVDLPRIAAAYAPLAYAQVNVPIGKGASIDQTCLPPIPVLLRHLTPWTASWSETTDGCVVREEGLPVLASLMTSAMVRAQDNASRAGEDTARMIEELEVQAALARHHEHIAAIVQVRAHLAAGEALTSVDRTVLRPFFAGREPSDAQIQTFGQRYVRLDSVSHSIHIPLTPEDRAKGFAQIQHEGAMMHVTLGWLDWAVSLGDGWSVGIIGNSVGIMRGEPPVAPKAPAPPSKTF